ncbi:hypothetical protein BGZ63DRAFT_277943 [Mariannaea sp. PMI_226]|nr:hypothetical protein BGZ63DRAFT_277943 [Mariannaea sp. PMI_226]
MSSEPPHRFHDDALHGVPAYSVTSDDSLYTRIEQATALKLPITHAPPPKLQYHTSLLIDDPLARSDETEACSLQRDIVTAFFAAIDAGHDDIVMDFVSRGFVSPDVTSERGETPLLAAVRVSKLPMISRLVALGATVNAFGTSTIPNDARVYPLTYPERTPLMLAAEQGNLALVKVLMEDYGADDSLVAPDGAIALRLAAANGHRDTVKYLPIQRAGAWLRWKTAHEAEMKRIRRALRHIYCFMKTLVWYIPRFIVYDLPVEFSKFVWRRRSHIATWCKNKAVAATRLPGKALRGLVKLPSIIKNEAKEAWKVGKQLPGWIVKAIKELSKAIWTFIKSIPGVLKDVLLWIGRGLKSVGEAIFSVFAKLLSLIHTIFSAIFSLFRSITLKDVWNGVTYLFRAVFVEMPTAIFKLIMSVGDLTYDLLSNLLGCFGKVLWYLGAAIVWIIQYIPWKLWQCLLAIGRSVRKAFMEIMAYLDPKRM